MNNLTLLEKQAWLLMFATDLSVVSKASSVNERKGGHMRPLWNCIKKVTIVESIRVSHLPRK